MSIDNRRKVASLPNGKIDWNKFNDLELMKTDIPRMDIIQEVMEFKKQNNCKLIMVSGRSSANNGDVDKERILNWTIQSLKSYGLDFDYIFMRKQNDSSDDVTVKEGFLKLIGKENVIKVWDDRNKVIRFWRSQGLDVVDVGDGTEF